MFDRLSMRLGAVLLKTMIEEIYAFGSEIESMEASYNASPPCLCIFSATDRSLGRSIFETL